MTAAPSPLGSVYVLHFASPYYHARHYIGFAADSNASRRLREHITGQGSPLVAAGIGVELAAEWIGTRADERKAHNAHGTRVCPRCRRPRARQLRLFTGGGRSHPPKDRSMTATTDRLADALDRLGALAQQTPAPSSSVELSQTAKGATQVTVKAYAADVEAAAALAQTLYDQLVAKYAAVVAP